MSREVKGMGKEERGQMKHQLYNGLKGILLGAGIIVPGVSGGTILVIFGIYEQLLKDVLSMRFKPYIALVIGAIAGVFAGGAVLSSLFEAYPNPTYGLILGCLLMSIPVILKRTKGMSMKNLSLLVLGGILSFSLLKLPTLFGAGILTVGQTFLAGFVSSATMMIPGISGSAVLIVLGVYEPILLAVREFDVLTLGIFLGGALAGVLLLARILRSLYAQFSSEILFFFSGLIIGALGMVLPPEWNVFSIVSIFIGMLLVYRFGRSGG